MAVTRVNVDQSTALKAVVDTLIKNYPDGTLSDKTCFAAYSMDKPENPSDDLYITVSLGGGKFNGALFVGGGPKQTCEECQVIISIWVRVATDQPGHDEDALSSRPLGILRIKANVLRALAQGPIGGAADLQANYPEETGGTNNFLRQWLVPVLSTLPEKPDEDGYASIALTYQLDFDWDLTS